MEFVLFIVASTILSIIGIPMMILGFIISGKKANKYAYDLAFTIDQSGNVLCAPVFNILFLHNQTKGKLYGNPDETISHVTGVNYLAGNLTLAGICLAKTLNFLDKNHVEKAANNPQ